MSSAMPLRGLPVQADGQYQVATTPELDAALSRNAVVCISTSGGKDSVAMAHAVVRHLDTIGHTGSRILVHADLGRLDWRETLPVCERLAKNLGLELLVVRRKGGDLLDLWMQRWERNVARFRIMKCALPILPWSTASMRFCTGSMKRDPIQQAITKRFPGQFIVQTVGLRAEESPGRAKAPVCTAEDKLARRCKTLTWHPVLLWPRGDLFPYIEQCGEILHEAYRVFGSTRLSCNFCMLASLHDLQAAARCGSNIPTYRLLVELEAKTAYSFLSNRWLADVAPQHLDPTLLEAVAAAKERAARRIAAEARFPDGLRYEKGWPLRLPTPEEAEVVAEFRRDVAAIMGIDVEYTTGDAVMRRFQELMEEKK